MDFTLYWFMFPVSIGVATCAMLSGIGGAALFTPIFVLLFPLLGPEYVLASTFAAISTALLTQTFGFLSGFIGYYRRRMIDFDLAMRFIKISAPIAVIGGLVAHSVHDGILIAAYALLVFVLAIGMLFLRRQEGISRPNYDGPYRAPNIPKSDFLLAGAGAFLTGLVSVGIGEVIISRLTKRGIPVGIAAATSVAIVFITILFATTTLVTQLIRDGGIGAVPWNLICYEIPGVLIGGQIGPRLQGLVSQRAMELAIGMLFVFLAAAMMAVAMKKLGVL
ncbi:MAG: sulfite exporter TauE/SafE family protein [Gammaproteobacteria bacterium]|nr:sulfite exporter TauE/SafE family protein [Gammaproteobacteria bacterium]NNL50513.1 sulfite exporter TauE/SafE family protein [Woeseiaceae bacterium]